ncbi:MAG: Dyp-type peroxidase [Gammaproteobacteria bacterium]|nr:Dyp-type peroxidase [Gammaproteobacteria bacterium]
MGNSQSGILADVPPLARYLFFSLKTGAQPAGVLRTLGETPWNDKVVIGLGLSLIKSLDKKVDGLRTFPTLAGPGLEVPGTPSALWVWLRGEDRGELLHLSRAIEKSLSEAFHLDRAIDAFRYKDSRDLTGYEDGTENPKDEDAVEAAIVQGKGNGVDGSSFVAVQQWVHDLDHFQAMPRTEQDNTIGRRIADNEEIDTAPDSAHVKRTAQESFDPEAFLVRRSMPWADETRAGLVFVAFGHTFDAFEAQLRNMVGETDGIVDALFKFTHPISGSYFWCPPTKDGGLDLSALETGG